MFGLDESKVRVFCERVGGGFGAKQEMLVEDIVALAALKTGKPVKLEFTRAEQFIGATTRHPMRVKIKIGARRDGTLTAMQMHVVSNTGAYGNHGGPVLHHACSESISVYRCANKKVEGYAVYTNTVPAGAFRGYGLPQTGFAVESAIDEVARAIGMDALEFRRRNVVRKGDKMIAAEESPEDVIYGSYGLDQCLDLVDAALRSGDGDKAPSSDWATGQGVALTMIDTVPPGGHYSDTVISLRADGGYAMTIGTAEFGNGTTTVHQQIAATALTCSPKQIRLRQSDSDHGGHDTGAYGSTGTVIAGRATQLAARSHARAAAHLRRRIHQDGPRRLQARRRHGAMRRQAVAARGIVQDGGHRRRRIVRAGHHQRHSTLGRFQRAGLPRGGASRLGRSPHSQKRAGR